MPVEGPKNHHRPGEKLRSRDWNQLQIDAREALNGHQHQAAPTRVKGDDLPSGAVLHARRLETDALRIGGSTLDDLFSVSALAGAKPITGRLSSFRTVSGGELKGDLEIDGNLEVDGDLTVDGSLSAGRILRDTEAGHTVDARYLAQSEAVDFVGRDEKNPYPWTPLPGLDLKLELDAAHVVVAMVNAGNQGTHHGGDPSRVRNTWLELGLSQVVAGVAQSPMATAMSAYDRSADLQIALFAHAVKLPAGRHLLRCSARGQWVRAAGVTMYVLRFRAAAAPAPRGGTK